MVRAGRPIFCSYEQWSDVSLTTLVLNKINACMTMYDGNTCSNASFKSKSTHTYTNLSNLRRARRVGFPKHSPPPLPSPATNILLPPLPLHACNMQHATCNMQHATCDMQHATCDMQHATCPPPCPTCSPHAHQVPTDPSTLLGCVGGKLTRRPWQHHEKAWHEGGYT